MTTKINCAFNLFCSEEKERGAEQSSKAFSNVALHNRSIVEFPIRDRQSVGLLSREHPGHNKDPG
jgi:hypothetical protein